MRDVDLDPEAGRIELEASLLDGAVLTERARSLSGGQRQRVALARALAARIGDRRTEFAVAGVVPR